MFFCSISKIGQVGLLKTEIDGKQLIELGYIFNDAYWHHGYAYEAAFQCLHYAFYHLDIDEVVMAKIPDRVVASP